MNNLNVLNVIRNIYLRRCVSRLPEEIILKHDDGYGILCVSNELISFHGVSYRQFRYMGVEVSLKTHQEINIIQHRGGKERTHEDDRKCVYRLLLELSM